MKYGNCLLWAIKQKLTQGGYIKITRLRPYWFVPRTKWSKDKITWYRYAPYAPVLRPTTRQKWFPFHVILFKGYVKKD